MLKINSNPTFTAVVRLTVPGSDTTEPVTFTFAYRKRDAMDAWLAGMKKHAAQGGATAQADAQMLADTVVGWDGVIDEAGNAVPFSVDALGQLFNSYPAASAEVGRAYTRAQLESRSGN